ncbi:hypothetical protein CFter6_4360 [Collimonas fungivorans]|uniref:Uncharacterized protein n=1 Tax=Collimonas fungivorans TaxID=158899 RepID=A0A127PGL7_9BURK|nr:hypothetical protein CFter6_4360 [Collimonas fungivorans]
MARSCVGIAILHTDAIYVCQSGQILNLLGPHDSPMRE